MLKIVVADDHGLYRRGLRLALQDAFPDAEILEVDTFDAVLRILREASPVDLTLLDLTMPGLAVMGALRGLRRDFPTTKFLILSGNDTTEIVLETIAAGLHGYIAKSQTDEEIIAAVSDILSGRVYVPPWITRIAHDLIDRGRAVPSGFDPAHLSPGLNRLTPRQQDVLALVAEGLSNKEIARKLDIAEPTTKIHVAALMRALNVRNRTEAAVLARTWLGSIPWRPDDGPPTG